MRKEKKSHDLKQEELMNSNVKDEGGGEYLMFFSRLIYIQEKISSSLC